MSILQDLDPQYAKIHAQPSSTWKPAVLAGTALFALGGGYWAMTQLQATPASPEQTPASYTSPASPTPGETQKNVASTSPILAKQETPYPMTMAPSASLGATIREKAERTMSPEQQTLVSTPAVTSESRAGSLADTEYRRPTQATASHAKTTPAHSTTKSERKSAGTQGSAKSEKNQPSGGKRTNERDIDIITAIVR